MQKHLSEIELPDFNLEQIKRLCFKKLINESLGFTLQHKKP